MLQQHGVGGVAMPVQIYTQSIEYIGQIDRVLSREMTRCWNDAGHFSFQTNINEIPGQGIQPDFLVMFDNDPHRAGIVRTVQQTETDALAVTVSGEMLNGLFSQRLNLQPQDPELAALNFGYDLVPAYETKNQVLQDISCESILKDYVDRHCVRPTDLARKISGLCMGEHKNRGTLTKWMARNGTVLLDTLKSVSEYSELGFETVLNPKEKTMVFDIIEGKMPPVYFSTDFLDVISMEHQRTTQGTKNVGYAAGMTYDDFSRLQLTVTAQATVPEGITRREVFLDCGNLMVADTTENISLSAEGEHRIADYIGEDTIGIKIAPNYQFVYRRDYDIGDIVKVYSKRMEVSVYRRITAVTERLSSGGLELELMFGKAPPNFAQSVKRLIKNHY